MTEPWPTNSVSVPSMKGGRNLVLRDRSTTTWNDPLAASYRLSEVIDWSRAGSLRTVVDSANGFRSCGSRCTAENTRTVAMTAVTATASTATQRSTRGPRRGPPAGAAPPPWPSIWVTPPSRRSLIWITPRPGGAGARCTARTGTTTPPAELHAASRGGSAQQSRPGPGPLSAVVLQECQGPAVELLDVLVERCVGAVLEDGDLRAPRDPLGQRFGEAGRAHGIVAAERDEGRRLDHAERVVGVMGQHRPRLAHEGVHRRHRAAAHEVGQRVEVLGPFGVKPGGEAPGEDPLDHHVGDAAQSLRHDPPALDDRPQELVAAVPGAVQG